MLFKTLLFSRSGLKSNLLVEILRNDPFISFYLFPFCVEGTISFMEFSTASEKLILDFYFKKFFAD